MNKTAKIVITISLAIVTVAVACLAIYCAISAQYLYIKITACISLTVLGIGFACSIDAIYSKESDDLKYYKIKSKTLKIVLDETNNDLMEKIKIIDKIKSCKSITQVRKILDEKNNE